MKKMPFKDYWGLYIAGFFIIFVLCLVLFTGCYSHSDFFLVPTSDFVKIPDKDNLYYVPAENNMVYYINYSWSGERGFGIMNEWRNGDNDKIYHYDISSNTMYTLED